MNRDRAQAVLLTAVLAAVAVLALVATYHGLADPGDRGDRLDPATAARSLERPLGRVATRLPANYDWGNRAGAVAAVREQLRPAMDAVRSRAAAGSVAIAYNRSRARAVARQECPGGPDRQFGGCLARDGVVVQKRGNATHVVAVTVDLTVRTVSGRTRAWLTLRP